MRDYYYLDIKQGRFLRVPEFPKDAWFEGVVNALCHRSYNIQGNPIMIRHFDDRLEIANSGPLPAQVTVENIESQRYSRNPRIARTLIELGYVRELNEGVPRIYQAMREFMLQKPEYADDGNTVTLTLRNKVSEHKETILAEVFEKIEKNWAGFTKIQQAMIAMLFDKQELTIVQIIEAVGLSKQTARYNLRKFDELGIIERVSEKIRDLEALYRFKSG
jgi:ATP-dependent DNA helicase RecG